MTNFAYSFFCLCPSTLMVFSAFLFLYSTVIYTLNTLHQQECSPSCYVLTWWRYSKNNSYILSVCKRRVILNFNHKDISSLKLYYIIEIVTFFMRTSACKLAEEEHTNSLDGKLTNALQKAQQLNQLGKKNDTRYYKVFAD